MPHRPALLLLAALAAVPCVGEPPARPTRNILVLHSYQAGPDWVENINEGIASVFAAETRFDAVYRYEYMNVLDSDPAGYPQVYGLRLADFPFDLVLCVDNQALEFVIANRDRYFRDVPVVFCSVDNFSPRLLQGQTAHHRGDRGAGPGEHPLAGAAPAPANAAGSSCWPTAASWRSAPPTGSCSA